MQQWDKGRTVQTIIEYKQVLQTEAIEASVLTHLHITDDQILCIKI